MSTMRGRLVIEYLPFRAMAETARYIFAHAGIGTKNELVWGREFQRRRMEESWRYPVNMVPVLHVYDDQDNDQIELSIAESGSIARMAAKLGRLELEDAYENSFNDMVFELCSQLCTVNPLINCYIGPEYTRIERIYFARDHFYSKLLAIQKQLLKIREYRHSKQKTSQDGGAAAGVEPFFGGASPAAADFHLFHHIDNAITAQPECLTAYADEGFDFSHVSAWLDCMHAVPAVERHLQNRPTLVGIGSDPGLLDRKGVFVSQRQPHPADEGQGAMWLTEDGLLQVG